ncbi:MAG TPA: hypothetical protein VFC58_08955 [Desulfosporosinus sp.]|nr:hypothetical protein [Desulfosporosinus sp.]
MSDEQLFGTSITEIIKKRLSVRTYLAQPLLPETKDKLRELFSILNRPFGRNVRFNLIESDLALKKSEFSKAIEQRDHEILPCITPIGYPSNKKSLIDSAMRFVAGSKSRKSWNELFFRRHLV